MARRLQYATALMGLGAQLLVDTVVAPANWLPVLVIAAFMLASERAGQRLRTPRNRPWSSGAALFALVVFTAWLGWQDMAQYHFDRRVRAIQRENFETASREMARVCMRSEEAD